MKTKTVYSKATGQPETAYESPLEPGVFLMPANTTEIAPPQYNAETQMVTWNGDWLITDIPQPEPEPEPEEPELTFEEQIEQVRQRRKSAYQAEADPLFFKWQAGEGTQEEWIEKREEIRQRYPKE